MNNIIVFRKLNSINFIEHYITVLFDFRQSVNLNLINLINQYLSQEHGTTTKRIQVVCVLESVHIHMAFKFAKFFLENSKRLIILAIIK